jgi:uncharacterized LabA/DUF88 family protein
MGANQQFSTPLERVMVFIDGSNLYYGVKAVTGRATIDFGRFAANLCGPKRRLIHAHYYNVPVHQLNNAAVYAGQQRFLNRIRTIPHLSVHLGRLVARDRDETCPKCGATYKVSYRTEKGVDVQIAAHMLVHAFDNQYDTAILVSQDGDFAPVVAEIRRLGKSVENAEFPNRLPSFLSQSCSGVIQLDGAFLKSCMF